MLIVIDNVLSEGDLLKVRSFFDNEMVEKPICWKEGSYLSMYENCFLLADLLEKTSLFFDLSQMEGCEYWGHKNTHPEWHIDKDEVLLNQTGEIQTPLCSIVFYPYIENLQNGNFITETERIKPVTNRMIIFSPGVEHCVEKYSGIRTAISINPWRNKPKGY